MRILVWVEQFAPDIGGVETLLEQLLWTLQPSGYEFCVITSIPTRRISLTAIPGVEIHHFAFRTTFSRYQLKTVRTIVQTLQAIAADFQPDLIHLHSQGLSLFFLDRLLKLMSSPPPLFLTLHSPVCYPQDETLNLRHSSILGQLLIRSRQITSVSQSLMNDTLSLMPELQPRMRVIQNGLPLPDVSFQPIPFDPPICLCIGRVVEEKGFDLAITAFRSVLRHHPGARLRVAGQGIALPDLQQQVEDLGLQAAVEFLGWVDPVHIATLINAATVVIVPSRWLEPFGLVAVQAAQMARPVIGTNIGGLPEIVVHQKTGLLVEPENPLAIATAIDHLLNHPTLTIQMGQAARKHAIQHFSMQRCARAYEQLYQSDDFPLAITPHLLQS